jgi:antitoxin FitA
MAQILGNFKSCVVFSGVISTCVKVISSGNSMAAMTIRKLSDHAHVALKQRALLHGRSAEAEARLILESELLKEIPAVSAGDVFSAFRKQNSGGLDIPAPPVRLPIEPANFE